MEKVTTKAKLVAKGDDGLGYITYVFEIIDDYDLKRLNTKYIMCVRYPNWDSAKIYLGEKGYLEVMEVIAGVDKYFKNNTMIPYNYSNVQFLKFIPEKTEITKEIIVD